MRTKDFFKKDIKTIFVIEYQNLVNITPFMNQFKNLYHKVNVK